VVHGERVVDETPHIRLSLADVELPDGVLHTVRIQDAPLRYHGSSR
jgi:hypothetical protein